MKKATLGQASYVLDLLREKDVSSEKLQAIDRSSWQKLLRGTKIKPMCISKSFTAEHFPLGQKPDYEYDLVLVEFDHEPTKDEVLAEFKEHGLERPEVEDILAFGAAHPDVQRKFPVVALIPRPWRRQDGYEYVPDLGKYVEGRYLSISCIDSGWLRRSRFLARRPRKPN